MFVRFSAVAGEQGSADTVRDPRGFAIKFYTAEGNYDVVGNNTPVFFIRDASKFSDFIHSQKRMPETGLRSNDAQWDFWTLSPESAHQVTILMSDRGTPRSWRTMHGYGSHTFLWVNAVGERFWVKYHLKTVQGIDNFTAAEAAAMTADGPRLPPARPTRGDRARRRARVARSRCRSCRSRTPPSYRFNPFDVTKVWPHADYPPVAIGRLILNRNPLNHFAEVEQAAFEPGNMVPGIGPSPDKMLMGRIFSYPDAHRYRIGANYLQLPINRPRVPIRNYNQDGAMRYLHNRARRVYAPNGYGGPQADPSAAEPSWAVDAGEIGRYAYEAHADDDDFVQAGVLWRDVLSQADRTRLVANVVEHLGRPEVSSSVLLRAVAYWRQVEPALGAAVSHGLGLEPLTDAA